MTTVGVLGCGRMGSAMARAIAGRGFQLVVYNRSPEPARALAAELGGRFAATPAEAARQSDVCLSMLADGSAVESVYRGPDGAIEGLRAGSVIMDMSTVSPETIRGLAPDVRAAGAGILDAPVSGSVSVATAGQLTIMVGGETPDLERARPVLDAMARLIFHIGPLGTGATMKLAVNAVIYGLNQAVAEGLVLAEQSGIEPATAYDVLAASAAGAPFLGYKRAAFLDPEGTPVAFALELAEKDLRLISSLADSLGVEMPQAATNLALIVAAGADGRASRDFSTVATELRDRRRGSLASAPRPREAPRD